MRPSLPTTSKQSLLFGSLGVVLLGVAVLGGYRLAGGSGKTGSRSLVGTLPVTEIPLSRGEVVVQTSPSSPAATGLDKPIPEKQDKIESSEPRVSQRKFADELLIYPGLELTPSPALPPKEGINQGVVAGWSSDTVATVIEHFRQKFVEAGLSVESRGSVGESIGTLIAKKPEGGGSVEVNVGREEGGQTRVIVQFEEPK